MNNGCLSIIYVFLIFFNNVDECLWQLYLIYNSKN